MRNASRRITTVEVRLSQWPAIFSLLRSLTDLPFFRLWSAFELAMGRRPRNLYLATEESQAKQYNAGSHSWSFAKLFLLSFEQHSNRKGCLRHGNRNWRARPQISLQRNAESHSGDFTNLLLLYIILNEIQTESAGYVCHGAGL